ncbi:hypothetical protein ACFE04_010385 [Oxalis oulophora]
MGTAILRSPNCFRTHHETLIPNPNPNVSSSSSQRRRKRSPNSRRIGAHHHNGGSSRAGASSSFQSNNNNNCNRKLVMGQVRILKRGESLIVGSTDRLGPEASEKTVLKKQLRVNNMFETYAGSSVYESPPPSSLPVPGFIIGRRRLFATQCAAGASCDLRRLLRLDVGWLLWISVEVVVLLTRNVLFWVFWVRFDVFCISGAMNDYIFDVQQSDDVFLANKKEMAFPLLWL